MLTTLFPKAFHKHSALPLLGSIADNFDDWLFERGYTVASRTHSIETLRRIDEDLRRRGMEDVKDLTHSILNRSWTALKRQFPREAGTVRVLEQFLKTCSMLNGSDQAEPCAEIDVRVTAYAAYLQEVRGLAQGTISHHVCTVTYFLTHLAKRSRPLQGLTSNDLEGYIKNTGKRLHRRSLQREVGVLRSFLRFSAAQGQIRPGLDSHLDTPRLHRLEQLPRALPWETVRRFLRSIDRTTALGLRDYTIFLLIATYGLRISEIVALTLEDVQWRTGKIRIRQLKTSAPLELPLTNEVGTALFKFLKRLTPRPPYRQLFLRMRAPIAPLDRSAVTRAFRAWSRRSGLNIPFQGAHCLRHSYAANLLRNGTTLKTIGDILGHRCTQSTIMYLRLAIGDLRDVALSIPKNSPRKQVRP